MTVPYTYTEQIKDVHYKYDQAIIFSLAIHNYDKVWQREKRFD